MCGIVGFITAETSKCLTDRQRFMRDGLIMDTLRGDDATGIFMVPHAWTKATKQDEKVAYFYKKAVPGHTFVNSSDYARELYPIRDWRAVIGHNRAATRGRRDDANAHPFQEGPVSLVHNGTLTTTYGLPVDQWELNRRRPAADAVSVDSHVLCHNLSVATPEAADEVFGKVRGAFALVWNDARDESVNIIRNDQRPLHMAYAKDEDTLYIMSESEMMYALCRRGGIKLHNIFYPKPGVWMKWLPDTPIRSPIVKEVELAKAYSYSSQSTFSRDDDEYAEYAGYSYGGTRWDARWREKYATSSLLEPTGTQAATQTAGTGVTPPGKQRAALEGDHRVKLLGRRREVPAVHQDNLILYGLLVEECYNFLPHVPTLDLPDQPGPVAAQGMLYGGDGGRYSSVVYAVPSHTYQQSLNVQINERGMWTVRPVAVQWIRNARHIEEPVIICHLVRPWALGGIPPASEEEHPEGFDSRGYQHGPKGIKLSPKEYDILTKDGCAVCNLPIGRMDADLLEWIESYPICPDCQDPEELDDVM